MNAHLDDESVSIALRKIMFPPKQADDVKYIILYKRNQVMFQKLSSAQLRAARALLRWSALDLAAASKVGVATIRRVEVVEGEIPVTEANKAALRQALENAGVEFIDENGGGPGVRLASRSKENP
jgi:hypothetical protein